MLAFVFKDRQAPRSAGGGYEVLALVIDALNGIKYGDGIAAEACAA